MKTAIMQMTAKSWGKTLEKLNEAQPGEVCICYQDEQGNKRVGYTDLFQMQIEVDGKPMKFGSLLEAYYKDIATKDRTIAELKLACEKAVETANKALETAKNMERYMPTDYVGL
jgi:hypothetical protein